MIRLTDFSIRQKRILFGALQGEPIKARKIDVGAIELMKIGWIQIENDRYVLTPRGKIAAQTMKERSDRWRKQNQEQQSS